MISINKEYWTSWLKKSGVRAIKTVAQQAVSTIGTAVAIGSINWISVASSSLLAGLVSMLISLKGLPELNSDNTARGWTRSAIIRVLKTIAESAVATIGTAAAMGDVKWGLVASTAVVSGILSALTSVAGLPEVSDGVDNSSDSNVTSK